MARLALVVIAGLLAACWADFPDSRFNQQDASPWPDIVYPDGQPPLPDGPKSDSPPPTDGPLVDQSLVDQSLVDAPPPTEGPVTDLPLTDAGCTPGVFLQCNKKLLEKCNATGTGVDTINCAPGNCDDTLKRCDNCDPATPVACVGSAVVSCSADGVATSTPCALGCQNAQCCVDGDSDGISDCGGDCDDSDPNVFPNQTAFFDVPSNGSFDYNCDNTVEQEYPDMVNCQLVGGTCTGSGWVGTTAPACGAQGSFATCKKQGNTCITDPIQPQKQGCR